MTEDSSTRCSAVSSTADIIPYIDTQIKHIPLRHTSARRVFGLGRHGYPACRGRRGVLSVVARHDREDPGVDGRGHLDRIFAGDAEVAELSTVAADPYGVGVGQLGDAEGGR